MAKKRKQTQYKKTELVVEPAHNDQPKDTKQPIPKPKSLTNNPPQRFVRNVNKHNKFVDIRQLAINFSNKFKKGLHQLRIVTKDNKYGFNKNF